MIAEIWCVDCRILLFGWILPIFESNEFIWWYRVMFLQTSKLTAKILGPAFFVLMAKVAFVLYPFLFHLVIKLNLPSLHSLNFAFSLILPKPIRSKLMKTKCFRSNLSFRFDVYSFLLLFLFFIFTKLKKKSKKEFNWFTPHAMCLLELCFHLFGTKKNG